MPIFTPSDEDIRLNQEMGECEFDIPHFISDVCNDRYLLVIGSEAILSKEDPDFQRYKFDGDSDKYILYLLKQHTKSTKDYTSIIDFTENTINGEMTIRNLFSKGSFAKQHGINDIAPELKEFLETKLFRFVMTTTFDDYVEILMRKIYGDKLRVVNFGDMSDWNSFKKEIDDCKDNIYDTPTLLYVFGKATSTEWRTFVKNNNDAISFIDKWIKESGSVVDYIKSKRIMALGCKFENWYFRFFWYILKRDFQCIGDGEVAISLDDNNVSDQSLKLYLQQKNVKILPDAREFMRKVKETLDTESVRSTELYKNIIKWRQYGGVFISYNSKDFAVALQLFLRLKELGFKVWFDNDKLCGGHYETIIAEAINKASAFIAILSPNVANDFKNGVTNKYYNKEWRIATELGTERIIPLAVDGYDLRDSSIHNTFKEIIADKISGFDLLKHGDYDKLIRRLNELTTK